MGDFEKMKNIFSFYKYFSSTVKNEDLTFFTRIFCLHSSPPFNDGYVLYSEQVAENNGKDGKPIWMSYGGMVYDVTDFIHNHPGGSERILLAVGSVSSKPSQKKS